MLFRLIPELKLPADITITIRSHVIRIQIGDSCIETIIPITAEQQEAAFNTFNLAQ